MACESHELTNNIWMCQKRQKGKKNQYSNLFEWVN